MKNLYVLSTDKISRLFLNKINNKLLIDDDNSLKKVLQSGSYQHIYITNDEKVKEGDWCIDLDSYFVTKFTTHWKHRIVKKIILTINQELIYDGVQAIPDDFLEWFVKNPSFEFVKVEKYHGINTSIAEVNYISGDGSLNWQGKSDLRDYKIIIPRTTQQIIDEDFSGGLDMGQVTPKEEPKKHKVMIVGNGMPKQETLQEVGMYHQELFNYLHEELGAISLESEMQEIERIVLKNYNINALNFEIDALKREIKVLKHQKEQDKNKYSEEDMIAFGNKMQLVSDVDFDGNIKFAFDPSQAIKQFKNK